MLILFIGLSSALLMALTDILAKFLLNTNTARRLMPINFLLVVIILILFSPFFFHLEINLRSVIIIVLIAFFDFWANYLYWRSIEVSEISHVIPISATIPLFTLIFSSIFLSGSMSLQIIIATFLIVSAIYILNFKNKIYNPWMIIKEKKNYLMLISAMMFGISAIPIKYALSIYQISNPPTLLLIRLIIITLVMFILFRKDIGKIARKDFFILLGRAVLLLGGGLLAIYAISLTNVNYAVALASTAPLFTLVFASIFFKEKITKYKIIAAAVIIIGIILFNVK